jgi:hypothetical protein
MACQIDHVGENVNGEHHQDIVQNRAKKLIKTTKKMIYSEPEMGSDCLVPITFWESNKG